MKSRNLLGLCSLLALFSACGNGAPKYDVTGTFETTEVLVSAEASGRLLYFDIEEGMLLKAGEEVGVVDTVQLYLKKLQLEASIKSVEEQRPDTLKQVAATKEQISAAQRERNRVANLLKVGAANQKQLDDAEDQLEVLRKQLVAQNSTLSNSHQSLTRSVWTTHTVEDYLAPAGFTNSSGRTNPTQNLVDSYETINGLPIDQDSSYDPQNPYANRDPRLEQTILHQGSIWGDKLNEEERAIDVSYPSGADYETQNGGTLTGYYTKKYLNNMSFKSPSNYNHVCPIFRFGEVLLNAAEAVNEAYGPSEAYQYINELRDRVGMPAYSGMNQEQLRERIRNERRIELCFEDHRFFDERRWKLFENQTPTSEKNLPYYKQVYNLYGVTVTNPENAVYTYGSARNYPSRTFNTPKNYYFPIPDAETKRLPRLGQNQGWELNTSTGGSENDSNEEETPAE